MNNMRILAILLMQLFWCASATGQEIRSIAPGPEPDLSARNGALVEISLSCMTGDLVRSVVVAKDIQLAEDRCADELQTHFENALSTAEVTAILSMVVAHNFAPYGASSALKYDQLINEAKLDCDNYSALQGHLASDTLQFRYVGFEGGSLGNHAQVYLEAATDHRAMFLDPTVSIFAFVDFDDYLQGKKVDAYQIS